MSNKAKPNENPNLVWGIVGYFLVCISMVFAAFIWANAEPKPATVKLDLTTWECKKVRPVSGKLQCVEYKLKGSYNE